MFSSDDYCPSGSETPSLESDEYCKIANNANKNINYSYGTTLVSLTYLELGETLFFLLLIEKSCQYTELRIKK